MRPPHRATHDGVSVCTLWVRLFSPESSGTDAHRCCDGCCCKVHETERANLSERTELLEEKIRQMEIEGQRVVAEAESAAMERFF